MDTFVDLQTKSELRLSNLGVSDAQLNRIVHGLTFQEKLDILLQDFLPQRTSPTGAIEHVSLAELLTGSLDVVIGGYELRVVGNGSALAIGIFFARAQPPHSAALANQDEAVFADFATHFLNGQRFGVAVSTELIDRFVLHRPEVEAALHQALPPELYTPEDPAHFVTLTAEPPNRFKLSGRGEFQTEDCGGVDADWWVFVEPFIQDGFLKIRADANGRCNQYRSAAGRRTKPVAHALNAAHENSDGENDGRVAAAAFEARWWDEQILALRSGLYLFGNERLTRFDLERPWLPRLAGSTKLRNAKSISHWGSNITATGPKGTQFLAPTADGNVVRFAQYSEPHWGNAFVADRHHRYLLNVDTDGRTLGLWRPRARKIRLSERHGLRERLNHKGRSE